MVPAMIYASMLLLQLALPILRLDCQGFLHWPGLRPRFILKTDPRTLPEIYISRLFACENTSYLLNKTVLRSICRRYYKNPGSCYREARTHSMSLSLTFHGSLASRRAIYLSLGDWAPLYAAINGQRVGGQLRRSAGWRPF